MAYYQNTIQDLYSGHFKNSYGVEGMCVTGRSDYKKIIDVSDDMKTHVLEEVKKSYYKYNGMSGGNESEDEAYARGLNEYYKTLDREDRLTLSNQAGEAEETTEKRSGKVAVNEGKRARQIASAKTPAQVQVVISLLKQDVADCENGLSNGMCDENEVKKAKALLQKAMDRLSEVSGSEQEQEDESQGSFLINMLM